jgi:hypothetical protein
MGRSIVGTGPANVPDAGHRNDRQQAAMPKEVDIEKQSSEQPRATPCMVTSYPAATYPIAAIKTIVNSSIYQ